MTRTIRSGRTAVAPGRTLGQRMSHSAQPLYRRHESLSTRNTRARPQHDANRIRSACAFSDHVGRRPANVPDHPEPRQQHDAVVGEVDLPPVEALALGGRVAVVVVVPALAGGDQGQPEAVAAGVVRLVAAAAEAVADRVDGEGDVVEHRRAAEQPHDHELPAAHAQRRVGRAEPMAQNEECDAEGDRGDVVVRVEPAELGELREVADPFDPRPIVAGGHDPAGVRPQESLDAGRMDVLRRVGVPVMPAVMPAPPQRPALRGRRAEPRQHELERAAGPERAVTEVAVVACGQAEHPREQRDQADEHRHRRHARPEHQQAGELKGEERQVPDPLNPLRIQNLGRGCGSGRPGHACIRHAGSPLRAPRRAHKRPILSHASSRTKDVRESDAPRS